MAGLIRILLPVALAFWATGSVAHPHIFISTGLELQFDEDGKVAAVRVVWGYDDFYSLSTLADRGLDPDADGTLTPEELAQLQGFDMRWIPGFDGDLYLEQAGAPVPLSGPLDGTAMVIAGRIVTTHRRTLTDPVDPAAGPLSLKVYDPTYYTAYDIVMPVLFVGRDDCDAVLKLPDETAANATLSRALAALGPSQTLEDAGVDVSTAIGGAFAQQVVVTCRP